MEAGTRTVTRREARAAGSIRHLFLAGEPLDEPTARALLTFAFCGDLIGRVPSRAVRDAAQALVAGALPDGDLIRGIG